MLTIKKNITAIKRFQAEVISCTVHLNNRLKDKHFTMRAIAFWNMDTAEYHWYLTNLQVPAQLIYPLYRNRWQIELLFKSLKSSFHLNEIPISNPVLIENLVLANLIASVIGSRVYQASQSNQKATLEPVLKPTQNPKLFSIQKALMFFIATASYLFNHLHAHQPNLHPNTYIDWNRL